MSKAMDYDDSKQNCTDYSFIKAWFSLNRTNEKNHMAGVFTTFANFHKRDVHGLPLSHTLKKVPAKDSSL